MATSGVYMAIEYRLRRALATMRTRAVRSGRFLLQGATMIVAPSNMERTWHAIQAGSIRSDWEAVGGDLRRSIKRKTEHFAG